MKWLTYAVTAMLGMILLTNSLDDDTTLYTVVDNLTALVFASMPVAVGIAVLRYRLYDIDALINRTLVYGSLTVTLALVYVVCVAALQYVFRALVEGDSQLLILVSTLAIAALFNPLRHRLQTFIDRRFYRRRYDAAKTLETFAARLREETDLGTLSGDLVGVVRETMQPSHVSMWLRPDTPPQGEQADQ